MAKVPGMSVEYRRGDPPPRFCARCLEAPPPGRAQKPWGAISEGMKRYYQERGYRALAQCPGCMTVLVEVE